MMSSKSIISAIFKCFLQIFPPEFVVVSALWLRFQLQIELCKWSYAFVSLSGVVSKRFNSFMTEVPIIWKPVSIWLFLYNRNLRHERVKFTQFYRFRWRQYLSQLCLPGNVTGLTNHLFLFLKTRRGCGV